MAQATYVANGVPKQIPRLRVTYLGLLGTISDVAAMPVVTMAGWVDPLPVSKANATLSLHGWPAVAESLSIDLGNVLTPRHLIGDERILISGRQSVGTAVVEARPLANIDWFQRADSVEKPCCRVAFELIHFGKAWGGGNDGASSNRSRSAFL